MSPFGFLEFKLSQDTFDFWKVVFAGKRAQCGFLCHRSYPFSGKHRLNNGCCIVLFVGPANLHVNTSVEHRFPQLSVNPAHLY